MSRPVDHYTPYQNNDFTTALHNRPQFDRTQQSPLQHTDLNKAVQGYRLGNSPNWDFKNTVRVDNKGTVISTNPVATVANTYTPGLHSALTSQPNSATPALQPLPDGGFPGMLAQNTNQSPSLATGGVVFSGDSYNQTANTQPQQLVTQSKMSPHNSLAASGEPADDNVGGWLSQKWKDGTMESVGTLANVGSGLYNMFNSNRMYGMAKDYYNTQKNLQNKQMQFAIEDRDRLDQARKNITNAYSGVR